MQAGIDVLQQDKQAVVAFILAYIAEVAEGTVRAVGRDAIDFLIRRGPAQACYDGATTLRALTMAYSPISAPGNKVQLIDTKQ